MHPSQHFSGVLVAEEPGCSVDCVDQTRTGYGCSSTSCIRRPRCLHEAYNIRIAAHPNLDSGSSLQLLFHAISLQPPRILTMVPGSQRQNGRDGASSMLNMAIEDLKLAKEKSTIAPAKVVFDSAGDLLPTIRVCPLSICVCRPIVG